MSGFTIGEIQTGDDEYRDRTSVTLVDDGVSLYHYALFTGGGIGTYTPAQARELGRLLINAADRWAQLNTEVKQAEAEIKATERTVTARIKDLLA